MIHTVKQPFMCRKDQFKSVGYSGQVLVVGIAVNALNANNPYRFKIGKSPTVYTGNSKDALQIAFMWKNRAGTEVAIVPVQFFHAEPSKEDKVIQENIVRKQEEQQADLFNAKTIPNNSNNT